MIEDAVRQCAVLRSHIEDIPQRDLDHQQYIEQPTRFPVP